jgi:feruloyl esterase
LITANAGALIGAPAYSWNHLNAFTLRVNMYQSDNSSPGYIPPDKVTFLAQQIINACDELDGVEDGVISNPRNCHFRPESLLCKYFPTSNTECFTPDQVVNLANIFRDYMETNSTYIFPTFERGSEWMWGLTLTGQTWPLQPLYYPDLVLNVSADSWSQYSLNLSTIELADEINPGEITADDPYLQPFFERSGKIIHYHGWADGLIPSRSSIDYYNEVERTISSNFSDNYRLFMVPGMGHCGSGPGPWVFNSNPDTFSLDTTADAVNQLVDWVENGKAPNTLLGTKYFNDTGPEVVFQRPICPYPSEAVWTGQGNWTNASTWQCK